MDPIFAEETNKEYFYKKVIRIGLPITLSQLLTSLLAFVDTIMVSSLGNNAVGAVGIGANFYFLSFMINFGLISGLSIFFAQYWGSKDIKNIHKTFVVTVIASFLLTSIFVVFGVFFGDFIVSLYNNTESVVDKVVIQDMGIKYLRIAAPGYFFTAISFVVIMLMRSMEKIWLPQIVTLLTVIINTILNYGLINGNLGMPSLGVEGAAIATLTSSFIGATILISSMILSKEEVFKIKLTVVKEITRDFLKKLLKKAIPVVLNETFWGLGMSLYIIAFSYVSNTALQSYHITNQIMGLFWVFNAGISSACAIMLGNKLGENKIEVAKEWGKRFVKLSFGFGVILGVILFIISPYIPLIFKNTSIDIQKSITQILMVFAFFVPIKFTNAVHIIGTLRSGGDTTFAFIAEVSGLWGIGIPLAFILSLYTTLPLYLIVLIVNIEEVIKFFLVNYRFLTYKWLKNLT